MRKLILTTVVTLTTLLAWAGEKDNRFTLSAGFLVPNTLNAQIGYERELKYGNALELLFEAGNRYKKDPVCGKYCSDVFWDGYYWAGGISFKKMLAKFKNSNLRLRIGPQFGAYRGQFTYGGELSLEYNIHLENGIQIVLMQKNQVNFNHGDAFRNGLHVGLKIPF